MATMNTLYVLDELCIYLIKSPRASRRIRPTHSQTNTLCPRLCCIIDNASGFCNIKLFMEQGCQPFAQPPAWRTRGVFVRSLPFDLFGMGDPTRNARLAWTQLQGSLRQANCKKVVTPVGAVVFVCYRHFYQYIYRLFFILLSTAEPNEPLNIIMQLQKWSCIVYVVAPKILHPRRKGVISPSYFSKMATSVRRPLSFVLELLLWRGLTVFTNIPC